MLQQGFLSESVKQAGDKLQQIYQSHGFCSC